MANTVELTLAEAATAEDYVALHYTPPSDTAAARTRDLAGNAAAGWVRFQGGNQRHGGGH